MKIAIDIRTAAGEKAGKGWYTFNITQHLLRIDQKNEYLLYTKEPVAGFEQFKNVEMHQIKASGLFWHYAVARDVKRSDVDIFFAPSSFIVPALLPKNIKTIVTVHDLVAFLFPEGHDKKAVLIEKLFLRRAVKKADKILAVSQNTKEDLEKKFSNLEDKIDVVPCAASEIFKPIDKSKLTDFIKDTNLPRHFFLAVGTLEPRKNYLNLISAFASIERQYPEFHLIIVGKKGWEYEEIFQEIKANYLQKKVHFLGYLSNTSLVNLYSLATALVFPSFYEGFGLPPLEAMQSGCPVIASNVSSIPEVVGDSALLIDPESYTEIADAMIKIIKDENLAIVLRNRGLQQAQKFSWEQSAKQLLEVVRTKL